MDMKPDIMKKFKPKVPIRMCETCVHRQGEFFQDKDEQNVGNVIRVYCRARYTTVNAEEMTKYCDFYKMKVKVDD